MDRSDVFCGPMGAVARLRAARQGSGWSRGRGQGGFGLLEVVIMLMLVSVVILVVIAGLLTSIKTSALIVSKRQLTATMNGAGEKLQEATTYVDCAVPADYDPADGAPLGSPDGTVVTAPFIAEFPVIDVNVTKVVYLDGGAYAGVCPAADQGAQLVTVEARTESGDLNELGTFVLRDDSKCTGC